MKKIFYTVLVFTVAMAFSSCKKYLDINQNPNNPLGSTPALVLPQAITATANQTWTYNTYGSWLVGYRVNGGGVSGWGSQISYNFNAADYQALWNNTYDILNDFQYVIDQTEGKPDFVHFNAVAKIFKAYNYQRLVDVYGDIPYTEASKGTGNLLPKYDKAEDIYKNLASLLDEAIAALNANPTAPSTFPTADVLFKVAANGNFDNWKRFANTIKLRLVVRASGKVTFANTNFDPIGFLTDDAIVNPGYTKIEGKQNPFWNSFAYTAANAAVTAGNQQPPSAYLMTFFNGNRLTDTKRANVFFKSGVTTATNQLGYQEADAGRGAAPNSWFRGTSATAFEGAGIFKGPDAGQPIFLESESRFLVAEAMVRGILPGGASAAKTEFNTGINSSFEYLYKNASGGMSTTGNPAVARTPIPDADAYRTANAASRLVNFDLATTDEQKIEAIITQKYIAHNNMVGDQSWHDYKRTGYPSIVIGSTARTATFVSIVSEATAADKLPTRILYPESEYKFNAANIPTIDKYTTKIFWAK